MPLYIRDEQVRELASRVAQARKMSITEVVRHALQRELEEVEGELAQRDEQLRQLFELFDSTPARSDFTDADLYDEQGLPK